MGDLDWEDWDPEQGHFLHHCIAGSIAGISEHTVMFPIDTIKTHVQCVTCPERHLLDMVRNSGMIRLWRGVSTMLTGCIPAHALYFSALEQCKIQFGVNHPGHHPLGAAAAGAVATVLHDAIMTPMDVIKQRLQLGYYTGIADCARNVYRSEGLGAFFLSFPTTLFMNIPYGCVMVAVNESLKQVLRPADGSDLKTHHFMIAGSGAGAVAAGVTNPLDVIKTRLQTQALYAQAHHFQTSGVGGVVGGRSGALGDFRVVRDVVAGRRTVGPPTGTAAQVAGAAGTAASAAAKKVGVVGGMLKQPAIQHATLASMHSSSAAVAAAGGKVAWCRAATCPKEAAAQQPLHFQYAGLADAAKQIYAKEGARGFMRGVVPRLLVSSPSVAVSWTAYEVAKKWLNRIDDGR